MDEKEVVQEGTVSTERPEGGTVLEDTGTLPIEGEEPKPLTEEERIRQVAAEVTETAKREIQSVKDKARAEVEQALSRASLAETTLAGMETGFREIDPEATESAKAKAELNYYRRQAARQKGEQAAVTHHRQFVNSINQFIVGSGVDAKDKRIDWGRDAKDYYEVQQRISASVVKIVQEDAKTAKAKASQKVEDAKDLARKDVDSVETSISAGSGSSDAEFIKKFGNGEIPLTKTNVDRYNKIIGSY